MTQQYTIQDIKNRITDWKELIQSITGERDIFTQKGVPCPSCGGRDRFAWHDKKQVFNCRGCNSSGDGFELLAMLVNDRSNAFKLALNYVGLSNDNTQPVLKTEDRIKIELSKCDLTDLKSFDDRLTGIECLTSGTLIYAPLVRPNYVPERGDDYLLNLSAHDYLVYDFVSNSVYQRSQFIKNVRANESVGIDKNANPTEKMRVDLGLTRARINEDKSTIQPQGVTVIGSNVGAKIYLCVDFYSALKANKLMNVQVWCVHTVENLRSILSKFNLEVMKDRLRAVSNLSYDELYELDYYDIKVILPEVEDMILDSQAMGKKLYTSNQAFEIVN